MFAIWMKLIQVFKPKNFHDLKRILNVVSCNEISLGQKCKKRETDLDGMVFKGSPSFYCPVFKGALSLGCPISSR